MRGVKPARLRPGVKWALVMALVFAPTVAAYLDPRESAGTPPTVRHDYSLSGDGTASRPLSLSGNYTLEDPVGDVITINPSYRDGDHCYSLNVQSTVYCTQPGCNRVEVACPTGAP